ncbi:alkaline phosphatase, partial [Candidatus Gastranaerophilus sp. (ex Termes propinquus)]
MEFLGKRFLNFLLALFLIVALSGAVFASSVKFAVLSDVHTQANKDTEGNYSSHSSIDKLKRAVALANDLNVDFVVFSGDNIDKADKDVLVIFAKVINKIKKPVYVGLGNHDVAQVTGLDKKEYYRLLNKYSHNKISQVPCV